MVTLKTCDLCSKKISAEEIEAGEVLSVQGKIFCPECKPKVIAKIKEQQAAAAGASPAPAQPSAPVRKAPSRKAPARGGASREAAAEPAVKPVIGKKRAAPSRAAQKPVAQKPAVGKPAAAKPKPSAGKPVAGKPAARGAPGRRAAPGRPGGRPAVGKGAPTRGKAPAAAAVDDDLMDEEASFEIRKSSKAPLYIVLSVVGVLIVAGLGYIVFKEDPKDTPTEDLAKTDEPKGKTEAEILQERAESAFKDAKKFQRKNPEAYNEIAFTFRQFAERYPGQADAAKALEIAQEAEKTHWAKAKGAWGQIRGEAEGLLEKADFAAARDRIQDLPDVISSLPFELEADGEQFAGREMENEIAAFRRSVAEEVDAYEVFEELERKAKQWAGQGFADIAEMVLNEFDEDYEDKAANVWRLKEESAQKIRKEGIAGFLAAERAAGEAAKKAEEERLKQESLARERRWQEKRDQVPWTNQLGKYNLYNWVIDSDAFRGSESRWKFRTEEGFGILVGNNPAGGGTMFIGPHTDRWQDFLVEFDVKVLSGSLEVSPRTRGARTRGGPALADESDPIVIGDDFPKSTWITITIEVHGDMVKWTRSDTQAEVTYTSDDKRLASQGGILFKLLEDSSVLIRKARARIVSAAKPV